MKKNTRTLIIYSTCKRMSARQRINNVHVLGKRVTHVLHAGFGFIIFAAENLQELNLYGSLDRKVLVTQTRVLCIIIRKSKVDYA